MPATPAGGDAVMSTQTPPPRTFTGWADVLASLENTLNHWLARSVEPPPEPAPPPTAATPLRLFEERLDRLQASLDRAERNSEQALAPITAEIEALRQWLGTLSTVRANLEEHTALAAGSKSDRISAGTAT
jgi:hypothetical protein